MNKLVKIDEFDSFKRVKDIKEEEVIDDVLKTVKGLDEKNFIEPFIRACIFDLNETPHGPVELSDIFTHRLSLKGASGIAAFVIKGKSFKKIRSQDVSHQIYRLKKINDLRFAIFAYTGNLLDHPKEEFITTSKDTEGNI